MSFLLEKVTELGATDIVPVVSQYTQQKKFNKEKAEQIVINASEQCGRLSIPKIREPQNLHDFLNNYDYKCDLFVADESLRNEKISITIAESVRRYALLVGPEGGFSSEERASFSKYPFIKSISLGKNILRSETAAIAIVSVIATTVHAMLLPLALACNSFILR